MRLTMMMVMVMVVIMIGGGFAEYLQRVFGYRRRRRAAKRK